MGMSFRYYVLSRKSGYIWNWSSKMDAMTPGGYLGNILTFSKGSIRKDLWHLFAATYFLHYTDGFMLDLIDKNCKEGSYYGLRAYFQTSYA